MCSRQAGNIAPNCLAHVSCSFVKRYVVLLSSYNLNGSEMGHRVRERSSGPGALRELLARRIGVACVGATSPMPSPVEFIHPALAPGRADRSLLIGPIDRPRVSLSNCEL